ncbi:hypothetical protein [Zymomonas mobilis]|uniref:hypothetical protein n=1 Tax=Zymomonas mobilis TaxID=542 RepID=UPI0039ECD73F
MTADNIITIIYSIATLSVSITIAIFTYQLSKAQKNIAKEKLKLDLFDRRYLIYKNTKDYLSLAFRGKDVRVDNPDGDKFHKEMFDCKHQSFFLLGREMSDELYKIYCKINEGFFRKNELKDLYEEKKPKHFPDTTQKRIEETREKIRLVDEEIKAYFDRLDDLFAPYMSFENLKIK